MINIEDYKDLAHHYANRSNKRTLQGIELDDLYQAALIGIWIASQSYDGSVGAFTTYAHKFIEGEINNVVYKTRTIDGRRQRVPRITETLLEDDGEALDEFLYHDVVEEEIALEQLLEDLMLSRNLKDYLYSMITHGEREATQIYMDIHGVTRQRAAQVRKEIRKVVAEYWKAQA